jgi:hypothetical protein
MVPHCHKCTRPNKLAKRRLLLKLSIYRSLEFQEVEAPRFPDNRHMKLVKLSAL